MKKIFLLLILFLLFFVPVYEVRAGLVPCGNPEQPACTIADFFIMLNNIYRFVVFYIATPLAVLMLTIGGVMILISAGNPQLASKGRELIKWAIIGLVLVFCAFLIIQFILTAMGYNNIGNWNVLTN